MEDDVRRRVLTVRRCCGCPAPVGARPHLACEAHWRIIPQRLREIYFRLWNNGHPREGFDEVADNIRFQIEDALRGND